MKNLIMLVLLLCMTCACTKETQGGPDKTYTWGMGEQNDKFTVDFKAVNTYKYTFALVNEGLCANKGINIGITINGKSIEGKDLSEMIYTKVLDVKTGDNVIINTKLIDTDAKIQCIRLGNVKCDLK